MAARIPLKRLVCEMFFVELWFQILSIDIFDFLNYSGIAKVTTLVDDILAG